MKKQKRRRKRINPVLRRGFGRTVRRWRTKRKLTQAELADRVGISRHVISAIENGRTSYSLDVLLRIAEELRVEVTHLFAECMKEYRREQRKPHNPVLPEAGDGSR